MIKVEFTVESNWKDKPKPETLFFYTELYEAGFDNGMVILRQETGDDSDWTINQGQINTPGNGPR